MTMAKRHEDPAGTALDLADRAMLDEIKANVLGRSPAQVTIGRFRVLERLGEGSMGVVFAAFDERLQRRVALKLLHQGLGATADERKARMLREAQVLARLDHPNIVHVHEAGEHQGQIFMAMELVKGQSLDEIQRTHAPDDWRTLLDLYLEAGRGLAAAHAEGVVHRDFKPHNVVVDEKGRARVVDFGLARESLSIEHQHTAEIPTDDQGAIERARLQRLTATGAIPGTPAYMAPELFEGQPASALSDQFSYCVSLYEGIYGQRPFAGDRLDDVVRAAREGRVSLPPLGQPTPRWLFRALVRGLSADPSQRYPSMDALLAELERDRSRGWKLVALLIAFGVVGIAAWWLGSRKNDSLVIEPIDLSSIAAQAQAAQTRACDEQTQQLRDRWAQAKVRLEPAGANRDPEALAVLDVSAAHLFDRWEWVCKEAPVAPSTSCREQVANGFEGVIDRASQQPLGEDVFFDLSYELDLCLEAGSLSCTGSAHDERAREALESSRQAEFAGDLDTALQHSRRALDLAEQSGDRLSQARALLRRGAILEARGEVKAARDLLERALTSALICDAKVLAIDAALEMAETEALHDGDEDRAHQAAQTALDILDKPGLELPLRRARALEKKADGMTYLEHRCSEAARLFEEALRIRENAIREHQQQGLPTAILERLAADAQLNLANTELFVDQEWPDCADENAKPAQAYAKLRQARDRFAEAVGSRTHLGLAPYHYSLGAAELWFGDPAAAVQHFERALAIYDAHHGPRSLLSANAHQALAEALRQHGDLDEALEHARYYLEVLQERGEDRPRLALAQAHDALGVLAHDARELKLARDSIQQAIEILMAEPDEERTLKELDQLRWSHINLAMVQWDRSEPSAARAALDGADAMKRALEDREGTERPDLPQQRLIEARLLLQKGQVDEARAKLNGADELPGMTPSIRDAIEAELARLPTRD